MGAGIKKREAGTERDEKETHPLILLRMLLPPSVNLFLDDCIHELDLHRFRDFLYDNTGTTTTGSSPLESSRTSNSGPLLMDILMKDEGNEQDLGPFDSDLLRPLQALPPGKLPGINLDASAHVIPTSIFSLPYAASGSSGNSPKRRKIDASLQSLHQNITIQHF